MTVDSPVDKRFVSRQSCSKATARVARSLAKQQQKKNELIGHMLKTITKRQQDRFQSVKRTTTVNSGRTSISDETKEAIMAFLECPDTLIFVISITINIFRVDFLKN